MGRKKNIKKQDIINFYMNYVLSNGKEPSSVFKFCEEFNFEEALFYSNYASFLAVKSSIFTSFFENTISVLSKSDDYLNYDARTKLLSFYYTFFEVLTANRSYVVYALQEEKNILKTVKSLRSLRTHFKNYIDDLSIETIELKNERLERIQQKAISESAWTQLLIILKFWLEDESASFEKTDIFIEKSVGKYTTVFYSNKSFYIIF
jgi:hypothetical protein